MSIIMRKLNEIVQTAPKILEKNGNGEYNLISPENMNWIIQYISQAEAERGNIPNHTEPLNADDSMQEDDIVCGINCGCMDEEDTFGHLLNSLPFAMLGHLDDDNDDNTKNHEQHGFVVESEHGQISVETTKYDGVWVSINDVKLVLVEYDEEKDAFVIRAYNKDMLHDDYEYSQEIPTINRQLKDKLNALIEHKKEQLNIIVIDVVFDNKDNAHILAKHKSDNTFIVWTSLNTGKIETTYATFHNGKYDMDLNDGVKELNRRMNN